jgi:small subunit ribosomal protein S20
MEKIAVLRAMPRPPRRGDGASGSSDGPAAMGGSERTRRGCHGHRPAILWRRLMANIPSQKKRILRAERERLENRRYTSTIKTYFRRLEAAVAGGDAEAADAEHRQLVSTVDKAVKRGALHRNTGARKKARAARLRAGADADAS